MDTLPKKSGNVGTKQPEVVIMSRDEVFLA